MAEEIVVYIIAGLVVAACVGIHFQAFRFLYRSTIFARATYGIPALVVALLGVHIVEVWIYALAYDLLSSNQFGTILGANSLLDYAYFSAAVYTTLGFGDLVPDGPLRALAGSEALAGLALITWSASFTFIEMQRLWHSEN